MRTEAKNKAIPKIGEGIYSIPDISNILFLPYSKVNYWLNVFWESKFITKEFKSYSFGSSSNRAVNFYTLIEFYVFYKLRINGLSAHSVQKAHEIISSELKTPYPFATNKIHCDGKAVWYEHHIFDSLIRADGKKQISIREIIEPFLKKIEFNEDGIAKQFYPIGADKSIVVNPRNQFGQPIIKGTNIRTYIIYDLLQAGESTENISDLYDLTVAQINDVKKYYGEISKHAA